MSSLPSGIMWNHASAIPAYAVKCTAYHHSYESLRRTTTSEVTSTSTSRNVPTVAVMIPGYGEVVGGPVLMLSTGAEPLAVEPKDPGAFGCGSVSQFQYSWNQFTPSCFA